MALALADTTTAKKKAAPGAAPFDFDPVAFPHELVNLFLDLESLEVDRGRIATIARFGLASRACRAVVARRANSSSLKERLALLPPELFSRHVYYVHYNSRQTVRIKYDDYYEEEAPSADVFYYGDRSSPLAIHGHEYCCHYSKMKGGTRIPRLGTSARLVNAARIFAVRFVRALFAHPERFPPVSWSAQQYRDAYRKLVEATGPADYQVDGSLRCADRAPVQEFKIRVTLVRQWKFANDQPLCKYSMQLTSLRSYPYADVHKFFSTTPGQKPSQQVAGLILIKPVSLLNDVE